MEKCKIYESSAIISECGKYRYELRRKWGEGSRLVNFIMLNPSTADGIDDDPTIRRCIGFAKSWGYDGMIITNLFAFRATKPKEMRAAGDPVGPDNMSFIGKAFAATDKSICAWGAGGKHRDADLRVMKYMIMVGRDRYALSLTKGGHPGHPLFLPGNLKPIKF